MEISELQLEWKKDAKVNELDLSRESLKTVQLHSKYIDELIGAKRELKARLHDLARVQRVKTRYYRGELSKDELKEFGLEPYQYNKPLKSEIDAMLDADEDCISVKERLDEVELRILFLESVMKAIQGRAWDIRNSVEYMKFQAGL